MLLTILVIVVDSAALVVGAAWGVYGKLGEKLEGFIVALAGGALIVSVVLELIDPATEVAPMWAVAACVLGGAIAFCVADWLVDKKLGSGRGSGLLIAVTLDGIPENIALGVALIGAGPLQVAALSGSILLSNLPEAAGGAKAMAESHSKKKVLGIWTLTAIFLSVAALAGNLLLAGAPEALLGLIRCVAGGAVVASLGTEVLPKAFKEDSYLAGVATAIGLVLAVALGQLA
jgi:ZIP family zinc transporter